jgi:hypothetical protein
MARAALLFAVLVGILPACGEDKQAPRDGGATLDLGIGPAPDAGDAAEGWDTAPEAPGATTDAIVTLDLGFGGGRPCNGWPALCDRPYDRVAFPATHAAAAVMYPPFRFPAQRKRPRAQLDENIRALMFDVHEVDGVASVCAGDCAEGNVPLAPQLGDVRGFLQDNPREVVTLLLDNHVPAARVAAALEEADLARFLHPQPREATWPTLGALVDRGERLVVFVSDAAGAPAPLLPLADWAFATRADFHTPQEVTCAPARGDASRPVLLVLHVLTTAEDGGASGHASTELAAQINFYPFLINRLRACELQHGRLPGFVAVDFYDQSDVLRATQELNGLIPAAGTGN